MHYFGMELDAHQRVLPMGHRRDPAGFGAGQHFKPGRDGFHLIPMIHPDLAIPVEASEQRMLLYLAQSRETVLALFAFTYSTAEHMCHELLPIADAEYGNALGKDGWIDRRAAALIHAVWPAGDD